MSSRASDSCLMLDYVHVVNFLLIIINDYCGDGTVTIVSSISIITYFLTYLAYLINVCFNRTRCQKDASH